MSSPTVVETLLESLVEMTRSTSISELVRSSILALERAGGHQVAWVAAGELPQQGAPALVVKARESLEPATDGDWHAWPLMSPDGEVAVLCARGPLVDGAERVAEQAKALWTSLGTFAALESMVAEEMMRVVQREESIQLILDSMSNGLVVCALDGTVGEIRSAPSVRWFGEPKPEQKLWDYLIEADQTGVRELFEVGWDQLVCGWLPFEVAASQIPRRLPPRDGQIFGLDFTPVEEGDILTGIVVGINDETTLVEAERSEVVSRELVAVVRHLVRDAAVLTAGLEDLERLCHGLTPGSSTLLRDLHTIKGNAAVLGLTTLANAVHLAEDRLEESEATAPVLDAVQACWRETSDRIAPVVAQNQGVQVSPDALGSLEELIRSGDHQEVLARVHSWRNSSLSSLFTMLTSRLPEVAGRHGKAVQVVIEDRGLHLPSAEMEPFVRTLAHVVRNALAHGIEPTEERAKKGKPPSAVIVMRAYQDARALWVSISDDGCGIDFSRIAPKAAAMGMAFASREDQLAVLCSPGISGTGEVDALAGRGVGLAAVATELERIGGRMRVDTELDVGTTWQFELPR